jgi:membrane carboxypeptidase/penicillin-binding protein PbpC
MVAEGYASQQEADAAASETLVFLPSLAPPPAPHFTRVVLDELERLRPDLAGQRGLIIETTLDLGLQDEAQRSVSRRLAELDDRNAHNAAVVVIDPGTGAVLAMVGNADFDDAEHAGQVNMALAERQPGSALKPFLYAAALERGYTAASPLLDVPTTFDTADGPYAPQNYDRRFHGIVPLRTALGSSFNVPAVEVLDDIGVDPFLDTLHRFGLTTLTNTETYGLALTLGGGEVRLLDLTAAYGAFAKGGAVSQPFTIASVRDQSGRVLYEHSASPPRPVVSPEDAYIIADILSDPAARTPGFGPSTIFDLPFPAGVKTGTTTAWKDNWTIGFTADRVVGVWVGNADNRPMQDVSGIDGAGPIWRDVMLATAKDAPPRWIERPPGIQEVAVCAPTGLLPGPACPSPSAELFASGTVPTAQEQYYQRGPGGALLVDVPPAARAWAAGAGFALATPASGRESASILQPAPGAILYLAPELDEQRLVLRASVPPGTTAVDFLVDGERAGRTEAGDASLTVPLTPGTHHVQIVASLGDGRTVSASSSYEVRTP